MAKKKKKTTAETAILNIAAMIQSCMVSTPPPRKRVIRFEPWRIDSRRFLIDSIRPYPDWPLICKTTNNLAFSNEKELKSWFNTFNPNGNGIFSIAEIKVCEDCGLLHAVTYSTYLN